MSRRIPLKKLAAIWNAAARIDDVMKITGKSRTVLSVRVAELRRAGWKLKEFPLRQPEPLPALFEKRVERGPGCWKWLGTVFNGRPLINPGLVGAKRQMPAQMVAYALYCAPVPAGKTALSICGDELCVCPAHLVLRPCPKSNGLLVGHSPARPPTGRARVFRSPARR